MTLARHQLAAIACFLGCAILGFTYDFSDRGPRFMPPQASAKTDRAGVYDLGRARMLTKVVGHVRSHYVDPERVDVREMTVAALRAVQGSVPEVMVAVERDRKDVPVAVKVSVGSTSRRFALDRVTDLFEFNWKLMDVFDFLQRHLPPTTDLEDLEYTAVNGLLGTLDPHSVLVTPQMYREMQLGTQGRFGGLGIVISVRDGVLTIMSVMDRTPAARSGLESGDQIVQIGEESTINMRLDEAVNRLRGEPGSEVTITVQRKGWAEPKDFPIVREEIRVPALDHHALGDDLGYIRIRSFQGNTFRDLEEALALLTEKRPLKGLVLDLRENPGGLLEQAIEVSDFFVDQGTLVTTVRERGKEREERHATRKDTVADLPIIVLINKGSASASEIVAGALKNNERSLVMGSTSFGKGSVQVIYQIDDAALKLTIAQYLTPGDVSIQSVGIVPDVEIRRVEVDAERMNLHPDELDVEGEAGLEAHLKSKKTRVDTSTFALELLEEEVKELDRGRVGGAQGEDWKPDALVRLAADLLKVTSVPSRKDALVQARGWLDKRQAEEDRRVATKLGELSIDWAAGTTPRKPKLSATLAFERTEGKTGRPQAGETIEVVATVSNGGRQPVFRLHGVLHSGLGVVGGRELVFGRLDPGASRTAKAKIELPRSLKTVGEVVHLDLYADGNPIESAKEIAEADFEVQGAPLPRFGWSAWVVDTKGSGDGLVQRGEAIEVHVRVENLGEGAAEDVLVTLKNESGEAVFIDEGRQKVGALGRGEERIVRFALTVREALKTQDVQLKLGVLDQGLRTWTQDELALPVFPKEFPRAKRETWSGRVGSEPATLRAGAHMDTASLGQAPSGSLLAVQARAGEWLQVRVGEPASEGAPASLGWIPADALARGERPATSTAGAKLQLQRQPPELNLQPGWSEELVTAASSVTVAGTARFSGSGKAPRYVYAFRNEDKVFFTAADTAARPRDALPFTTTVPLEPGRNALTVFAREGEDDVTRRSVVIYRR